MLQCPTLTNHPDKEQILTQITTGMKEVCLKGSNAANPNGSSNVAPETPQDGKPRSFEEVINGVFAQYGIAKTDYCNPFVIEFPKPYGKGPKFVQEMTTVVDTCNCQQFEKIKLDAKAKGYDATVLASLNKYLKNQYGDTLTVGLFEGLKHCDELKNEITCPKDQANCVSIRPGPMSEYDTFIEKQDLSNNSLLAFLMTDAYFKSGQISRSLLKFNLQNVIPPNNFLISAKLSLYADTTKV